MYNSLTAVAPLRPDMEAAYHALQNYRASLVPLSTPQLQLLRRSAKRSLGQRVCPSIESGKLSQQEVVQMAQWVACRQKLGAIESELERRGYWVA